jgi:hypothetical protein
VNSLEELEKYAFGYFQSTRDIKYIGYFTGGTNEDDFYVGMISDIESLSTSKAVSPVGRSKCFFRRQLITSVDAFVLDALRIVEESPPSNLLLCSHRLSWIKLGGSSHPDTTHFELPTSSSLLKSPKPFVELGVYDGENFVNGFSCRYTLASGSNIYLALNTYGKHDSPVHNSINLIAHPISIFKIRYGAIVDSCSIIGENSSEIIFGGRGGNQESYIGFPEVRLSGRWLN